MFPMSTYFQNAEYLIAFGHVCSIAKFPPDRIEVTLVNNQTLTILGDDCKAFLQGYKIFMGG